MNSEQAGSTAGEVEKEWKIQGFPGITYTMINKKEVDFVTLSLSHHIMQTMNPTKERMENGRRK